MKRSYDTLRLTRVELICARVRLYAQLAIPGVKVTVKVSRVAKRLFIGVQRNYANEMRL